ncbi:MAG: M23 family metallopeptidase [Desulfobacteraceae bacterium]|nr:MAG: M23 family metallopeptidase [Desulfobacteraceae bacterium]
MRIHRAKVIWMSSEGTGRIVQFSVSPFLLICFVALTMLCISAVPFLEKGILSLKERVVSLEDEARGLKGEIETLLFLKEAVAHIQENENILKSHFGLEKYPSLEKTIGLGGDKLPLTSWRGKNEDDRNSSAKNKTSIEGMGRADLERRMKALITNHESLGRLKVKQMELWEGTPSIVPLEMENPRVTSPFGFRKNPFTNKKEFHAGVDFIGPKGSKIIAPANGKVVNTGRDQWLGNYVVLHHAAGFKTVYGHLEAIHVREGDEIKRGDRIGLVGNTGLSTSPHLHYGMIKGDMAVDPMQFILDMKG